MSTSLSQQWLTFVLYKFDSRKGEVLNQGKEIVLNFDILFIVSGGRGATISETLFEHDLQATHGQLVASEFRVANPFSKNAKSSLF